jgi:peptidyl-prolyl cis-trans isomerase SurA
MKTLAFFLLTAGGFLLFSPNLSGEVVDRIAALVNGDVITLSEVDQMGGPFLEQVRQTSTAAEREEKMKKARVEILEHLIESKLLEEEMKKRKIEVPERDVDAAINDVLKNSGFTEVELRKYLVREGMTYSAYRQKVKDELGKMRLVNREIKSKIVINEDEMRKYYRDNQEKFTDTLEVKIQQIFSRFRRTLPKMKRPRFRPKPGPFWKRPGRETTLPSWRRIIPRGPKRAKGGCWVGSSKRNYCLNWTR